MWRFVIFVMCIAPLTTAAAAPATQPDIESLITSLSGDNWKDRQHAEDELVKLGPAARSRLEQVAREDPSDEVRTRAQSALRKILDIEETGTSFITLHAANSAVRDVFAQLSRQCHAELEPAQPQFWENAKLNPVSFDIEHEPFWTAMRKISEQTGLELAQWNDGMKLVQTGGNGLMRGPACVSGPFLIIANRVHRSESIDLSGLTGPVKDKTDVPPTDREFFVQLTVFAEPKLRILQALDSAKVELAVDENGNSLLPAPAAADDESAGFNTGIVGTWPIQARLHYPTDVKVGSRIKTLKGVAAVVLQTKVETIEVASINSVRNVTKSAGDTRLTFKSLTKTGAQYQLTATAEFDRHRPDDFNRVHAVFMSSDLRLLDANGVAWNVIARNINGNNGLIEATIDFTTEGMPAPAPGEPSRLVLKVPTETNDVSIPFEFTDLPIP